MQQTKGLHSALMIDDAKYSTVLSLPLGRPTCNFLTFVDGSSLLLPCLSCALLGCVGKGSKISMDRFALAMEGGVRMRRSNRSGVTVLGRVARHDR
jgi:hypothetical protein